MKVRKTYAKVSQFHVFTWFHGPSNQTDGSNLELQLGCLHQLLATYTPGSIGDAPSWNEPVFQLCFCKSVMSVLKKYTPLDNLRLGTLVTSIQYAVLRLLYEFCRCKLVSCGFFVCVLHSMLTQVWMQLKLPLAEEVMFYRNHAPWNSDTLTVHPTHMFII